MEATIILAHIIIVQATLAINSAKSPITIWQPAIRLLVTMKNQSNWRNFIQLNSWTLITTSRTIFIGARTHINLRMTRVCLQIQNCFQWSRAISRRYRCVNQYRIIGVISRISLRVNPLMKQVEMILIHHNSFLINMLTQQSMTIHLLKLLRWSDNLVNNIEMKRNVSQRLEPSRKIYIPRTSNLEKKNRSKTKSMKDMAHR